MAGKYGEKAGGTGRGQEDGTSKGIPLKSQSYQMELPAKIHYPGTVGSTYGSTMT